MIKNEIDKLLNIMATLRDPQGGCPWDQQQTFDSLTKYTLEEVYEVIDAIDEKQWDHLKSELGDLLFQVIFYSQIASENHLFDFNDVVKGLNKKMIERHPHVFSNRKQVKTPEQQNQIWEQNKNKKRNSVLDDIPKSMPELLKSVKFTKRAAVIGFDWPHIDSVFDKMDEEILELKQAIESKDEHHIKDELGDVLFVCTNLARHLGIDPILALRQANKKFENRFRRVEERAKSKNPKLNKFNLEELEQLWIEVKKLEY